MFKITFLGPIGATFSHQAYSLMASLYDVPGDTSPCAELTPVTRNGEVIGKVIEHGGYGAIAMETRAEGRVAEPLESFIDLVRQYTNEQVCPLRIIGAIKMKLSFCLMARPGVTVEDVARIVAHPKALGACKTKIAKLGVPTIDALSNGKAAEDVVNSTGYEKYAALAPATAADKYGLRILDPSFEGDTGAVTTFFLLGPQVKDVVCADTHAEDGRMLIVFRTPHTPGALVSSLIPFAEAGLNMIQIHSTHTGNGSYDFAMEIECPSGSSKKVAGALAQFKSVTPKSIAFGPFLVKTIAS